VLGYTNKTVLQVHSLAPSNLGAQVSIRVQQVLVAGSDRSRMGLWILIGYLVVV